MKLVRRFDQALWIILAAVMVAGFGFLMHFGVNQTFAEGDEESSYLDTNGARHVTFYDEGEKLTVKTDAKTVGEALERADIIINAGDIVEPGLDAEIDVDNYFINIYRAHPVVVRDGAVEKYLMTASYDMNTIAEEAGFTIYDGDTVKMVPNTNFLESGVANIYEITRNGGRTITVEEEIPFTNEVVKDVTMAAGKSEVKQLGQVGTKRVHYNVLYKDNKEVSREKVKEEVIKEPVKRIVAEGVKRSIPPEWSTCAGWARQAGVSEADLEYALQLIYRESGCRVDATNAYSGAYGIPQSLPGDKMSSAGADWETNPVTQIRWMAGYVNGRYGGWRNAYETQVNRGWY